MFLAGAFDQARDLLERGREVIDGVSERGRELIAGPPPAVQIGGRQVLLLRQIAEGGYAFVHLGRDATSGCTYAVKRMRSQDRESAELARAEIALMASLPPHPNIVRSFGSSTRKMEVGHEHLLLLEWCAGGSLIKQVIPDASGKLPPPLPLSRLLSAVVDVCKAVAHLHAQQPPIAHRDLKLENVLVGASGVCKLCDFGSATTRTLDCANASRRERLDEEDIISRHTTAMNRSPEMLDMHRGQARAEIATRSRRDRAEIAPGGAPPSRAPASRRALAGARRGYCRSRGVVRDRQPRHRRPRGSRRAPRAHLPTARRERSGTARASRRGYGSRHQTNGERRQM